MGSQESIYWCNAVGKYGITLDFMLSEQSDEGFWIKHHDQY